MSTQDNAIRIPIATFLHALIVMSGAFGAYYVSNEISPLRSDIEDIKAWAKEVDTRDQQYDTKIEIYDQRHKDVLDVINRHHETDLIAIQGLQVQINELRKERGEK